jgi:hypothetical protein
MSAGRRILSVSGAPLLIALAAGAIAAAQPAHPGDRHRIVQGWRVEDLAEEDGGRLVRLTRTSGSWRLEYQAAYWHGNDGVIQRLSAIGEGCGNDEALDRHRIYHVREIRARLTDAFAHCAAPPRAVRAALRGLERAYALALAWDRDAARAAAAEAPPVYGLEDATADACASAGGAAERDIAEMNAAEAVAC